MVYEFNSNELYDVVFIINSSKKINNKESYEFNNLNSFYDFVKKYDFINKKVGITGNDYLKFKYLLEFMIFYQKRLKEIVKNQNQINKNLLDKNDNKIINNVIKDFCDLNQDGKYIRATLIALGEFVAKEEETTDYLNLAYAYEMFQTSILIHDDIIDNARMRRNKETIPRRICRKYLNKKHNQTYAMDVLRLANSAAICAGDLGFYEANNIIVKNYHNNKNLNRLLLEFNNIVIKTIKGEILDVYLPFMSKYNLYNPKNDDILDIYHLKTSWYTIIGPFSLGYILGDKLLSKNMEGVLNKIGICFQLKDDILGIFHSVEIIGKSNVSDIEEFKQTILYSYIINTEYKNEFLNIYGKKNITNKDLNKIRELLVISGSYKNAINMLENLQDSALKDIDNLKINAQFKDILKGLLIYINNREK